MTTRGAAQIVQQNYEIFYATANNYQQHKLIMVSDKIYYDIVVPIIVYVFDHSSMH